MLPLNASLTSIVPATDPNPAGAKAIPNGEPSGKLGANTLVTPLGVTSMTPPGASPGPNPAVKKRFPPTDPKPLGAIAGVTKLEQPRDVVSARMLAVALPLHARMLVNTPTR